MVHHILSSAHPLDLELSFVSRPSTAALLDHIWPEWRVWLCKEAKSGHTLTWLSFPVIPFICCQELFEQFEHFRTSGNMHRTEVSITVQFTNVHAFLPLSMTCPSPPSPLNDMPFPPLSMMELLYRSSQPNLHTCTTNCQLHL